MAVVRRASSSMSAMVRVCHATRAPRARHGGRRRPDASFRRAPSGVDLGRPAACRRRSRRPRRRRASGQYHSRAAAVSRRAWPRPGRPAVEGAVPVDRRAEVPPDGPAGRRSRPAGPPSARSSRRSPSRCRRARGRRSASARSQQRRRPCARRGGVFGRRRRAQLDVALVRAGTRGPSRTCWRHLEPGSPGAPCSSSLDGHVVAPLRLVPEVAEVRERLLRRAVRVDGERGGQHVIHRRPPVATRRPPAAGCAVRTTPGAGRPNGSTRRVPGALGRHTDPMTDAFWVAVPRDVVQVSGPDALTYLHGQVSQGLLDGRRRVAVDVPAAAERARSRCWPVSGARPRTTFVFDVDAGFGDALVARLNRFRIRVKADVEPLPWRRASPCAACPGVGRRSSAADPRPPRRCRGEGRRGAGAASASHERAGRRWAPRSCPARRSRPRPVSCRWPSTSRRAATPARSWSSGWTPAAPRHPAGCACSTVDDGSEPGDPIVLDGAEVGVLTSVAGTRALGLVRRAVELGDEPGAVAGPEAGPAQVGRRCRRSARRLQRRARAPRRRAASGRRPARGPGR